MSGWADLLAAYYYIVITESLYSYGNPPGLDRPHISPIPMRPANAIGDARHAVGDAETRL